MNRSLAGDAARVSSVISTPTAASSPSREQATGTGWQWRDQPVGPILPHPAVSPPWLTPALLGSLILLTALTLLTTFVEPMPRSHHLYVGVALVPIVAAWLLEIFGARWPRVIFIFAIAGPNIALSALGHIGANFLFLLMLVAWLAYAGTRRESLFALAMALVAVGTAAAVAIANGVLELTVWVVWTVGIATVWIAARMLLAQQRLLAELHVAQQDLDRKARAAEALYQADERLYGSLELGSVLQSLVDSVTTILRADKCALMVWDAAQGQLVVQATSGFKPETVEAMTFRPGEGVAGLVFQRGEPIAVEDTLSDPRVKREINDPEGIRSVVSIPIHVAGEIFGVFGVNYSAPRRFTAEDIRLFQSLAQRAAVAISNARLFEKSQRVAALEERQRLARDLHDSATQSMYSARMYAEAASRLVSRGDIESAGEYLREVASATRDAMAEMRLLIYELRPPVLEEQGLVAALRLRLSAVEERAGAQVEIFVDDGFTERLPLTLEQDLYGVAQEALNNAIRHGRPSRVEVSLRRRDGTVMLQVQDNGTGFDPANATEVGGNGLRGMHERVTRHGGRLEIESAAGSGTRVRVECPL